MFVNGIKQDGLWIRPEGLEVPFQAPNPDDVQSDLTDKQRYALCVAVNEIVELTYNKSIIEGATPEMLADPRAVATYSREAVGLVDPRTHGRDAKPYRIPISAQVGGFTLYGAEGQQELDGYSGVRIDFADKEGRERVARLTTDWAMLDDEPLDVDTYESLVGRIISQTMEDDEDVSYEIFHEASRFAFVGSGRRTSNVGVVLDADSVTQVYSEAFVSRSNLQDIPEKFMQLTAATWTGLDDPKAFLEKHMLTRRPEAPTAGTVTELMFVLPKTMVALRRPLNGKRSSYEFIGSDDAELARISRLMQDLRTAQVITNIVGQGPSPLVINRADGSGIGIEYKLSDTLRASARLEERLPVKVISPEQAIKAGFLPQDLRA